MDFVSHFPMILSTLHFPIPSSCIDAGRVWITYLPLQIKDSALRFLIQHKLVICNALIYYNLLDMLFQGKNRGSQKAEEQKL